ncbi:MAG: uncharacterized membrane protein (UPF0127 family) [Alphaproteobacteria bacterium]|jgi:uncharacterized membrane protein (UPF0127 family)
MIEIITSQRKQNLYYQLFLMIWFIFINLCIPGKGAARADIQYQAILPTKQSAKQPAKQGEHKIKLEIARTEQQKMQGLMHRKTLAPNTGMIFLYNKPTIVGIWMKNTYIPLDIIFIDCHNKIVDVVTRQPHTTDVSYAPTEICKIIEVNAGLNEKIGLQRNTKVRFEPHIE